MAFGLLVVGRLVGAGAVVMPHPRGLICHELVRHHGVPRRLQSCLITSTEQRAEREATRDVNATAILHVSVRVRAVVCGFGYGGVWVQVCVWFMCGACVLCMYVV